MEITSGPDRVAELHLRLVEERDSVRRAAIHLELATMALGQGDFDQATRHFREALHFDGTLEHARNGLHSLGERPDGGAPSARGGPLTRLVRRFRKR